jgi:hypothetical protein
MGLNKIAKIGYVTYDRGRRTLGVDNRKLTNLRLVYQG